jgi:hypothetical protein
VPVIINVVATQIVLQQLLQYGLTILIMFVLTKVNKNIFNTYLEGKENDYLTHCFNENILYYYNRKRGMKEYRDPVSNLFCVTFDNSSIMGQFYKDITALTKTSITSIYQNYVDKQIKKSYYYNQNTGLILNNAYYSVGDYIKIRLGTGVNDFAFDGKFFLFQSGSFGECVKTNPVRFLVPNQKIKCGFKLVRNIENKFLIIYNNLNTPFFKLENSWILHKLSVAKFHQF